MLTASNRRTVGGEIKRPVVYASRGAGGKVFFLVLRVIKTTICFADVSRLDADGTSREYPTEGSALFGKRLYYKYMIDGTFILYL